MYCQNCVSKIEQKVFFPIARIVGFIAAAVLLVAIIAGIIFSLSYKFDSRKEIKKIQIPFDDVFSSLNKASSDLAYPGNVKEYLSGGNNNQILENWLEKFNNDKEKEAFLINMSDIIYDAERKDNENIYKYVNEYARMATANSKDPLGIQEYIKPYIEVFIAKIDPTVEMIVKRAILFGVGCLFMLFLVVTLTLLQFSIERNTRRIEITEDNICQVNNDEEFSK